LKLKNELKIADCRNTRPTNLPFWPTVGYMKLCVDRDLNCGRELVT